MSFNSFLVGLINWIPALFVLLISIGVLVLVNYLLRTRFSTPSRQKGVMGQLLMLVLTAVALVTFILTLPIGDTAKGQLLSLLGILLSAAIALSSTTFVGNAMGGMMLKILKKVRPGDFVRVGDHFGRVTELGLLHTELQTEDRELTTLPSLYLVTNPITVVRSSGTVISAEVSLGYDVPRTRIEKALLEAAERTDLADPFVRVVQLGDFAVTYRIAGLLKEVKLLLTVRSNLRKQMLDVLHERGIEIVSPSFMNQRPLKEGQKFIPQVKRQATTSQTNGESPEDKIFDKAEVAERNEDLRQEFKKLEDRVDELEEGLKEVEEDLQRDELERELERAKQRKSELEEMIKELESSNEEQHEERIKEA